MPRTKEQKMVIAEVSKSPTLAEGLARILEETGGNPALLRAYTRANLLAASEALPEVPTRTNEFQPFFELSCGKLEARQGQHSAFEFRLTLYRVQPGMTHAALETLLEEVNAKFLAMPNYPQEGFKVQLSSNRDLPNFQEAGDVVFTCSSLITDSTGRHRNETVNQSGDERISQSELLKRSGLVEVPNDVVRAVAAIVRLASGFPANSRLMATASDPGDMFGGMAARTKEGPYSGSVATFQRGICESPWRDNDGSLPLVGVVGGLPAELKAFSGRVVVKKRVPGSASAITAQKTSLQIAHEMVDSYLFNEETGISTFTVPPGVTDVEAMRALNEYFRSKPPSFNSDVVSADCLEWFEKLHERYPEYCQRRDYSQARTITITAVVEGTKGQDRPNQESPLKERSLVFADPRDQALAAAIHACKHDSEDLFRELYVRGSVPGFALINDPDDGVVFLDFDDTRPSTTVAASGIPSPESR